MSNGNQAKFSTSPIIHLNETDFTGNYILKHRYFQGRTGVIVFFMPGCIHCKNMEGEYTNAAKQADGFVPFGAIDGTKRENRKLLNHLKIQSFPAIRIVQDGFFQHSDYKGERKSGSFIAYACANVNAKERKNMKFC